MAEGAGKGSGTRRALLSAAGLGAAALGLQARAEVATSGAPRDVGRKFEADGRVRPFAGNTVIAHLPQQGEGFEPFNRLLDIARDLPRHPFSRKVTLLPSSSYHMTVFGGPTDQGRSPRSWPAGVPLDAPMEVCNAAVRARLQDLRLPAAPPFQMVVDQEPPSLRSSPITLHLRPRDEATAGKLASVRQAIGAAFGLPPPQPDTYRFHITLAYQIVAFTPEETSAFLAAMSRWQAALALRQTVFTFGAPEYCTFEDMFAFRREFYLRQFGD